MQTDRAIKVIVSMIGLDGHWSGGEVVSKILMDAGMEVVYLGLNQTPEMIVQAAIQEDVDLIGISSHASNYNQIEEMIDLMREKGMGDIPVICGGTIPKHQIPRLKEKGVAEVFAPRCTSVTIVRYIVSKVKGSRGAVNRE